MPVAVHQRLLARVRDQDESLGILIGVFAINPVLRRSFGCRMSDGRHMSIPNFTKPDGAFALFYIGAAAMDVSPATSSGSD